MGGRSHPKLNILGRPIANKYSDGKVKRTLKRRSKVLETVKRETNGASNSPMGIQIIHLLLCISLTTLLPCLKWLVTLCIAMGYLVCMSVNIKFELGIFFRGR
jgi:hypothetical protein